MNNNNNLGKQELKERVEKLEHERTYILLWIIAKAWKLMNEDERQEVADWKSYVEQHAPDVFESWGSFIKEDVIE